MFWFAFIIIFYLIFLTSWGSLIVCLVNGSWIKAYSKRDLSLIYFLLMIDSGIFIFIGINLVFVKSI